MTCLPHRSSQSTPQSKPLYEAFKAIRDGAGWTALSEAQQRIVEGELRDFVLGGVALEVGVRVLACVLWAAAAAASCAVVGCPDGCMAFCGAPGAAWLAVEPHALRPPSTNPPALVQGEAKERFNAIQQELSQLSTKFSNNVCLAVGVAAGAVVGLCCMW